MLLTLENRTHISPDALHTAAAQQQQVSDVAPTIDVPDNHVLVITGTYGVTAITEDGDGLTINPPDGSLNWPWMIFYGYRGGDNPNKLITAAEFDGAGLDDLTTGGKYIDAVDLTKFIVEIDSLGTPDTYRWSEDGGKSFVRLVPIVAGAVVLQNGVEITFAATTGHTLGDRWTFAAKAEGAPRTVVFAGGVVTYFVVKGS